MNGKKGDFDIPVWLIWAVIALVVILIILGLISGKFGTFIRTIENLFRSG